MLEVMINGRREAVDVPPEKPLLDVLREDLGLTGTKEGCREGECGACTVIVNGRAVDSCIYPAGAVQGAQVETVEALDPLVKKHVQDAMVDLNGIQCGFCTPGFVVMLTALLQRTAEPSEDLVKDALSGNICRCTGYSGIIDAALEAARRIRASAPASTGEAA